MFLLKTTNQWEQHTYQVSLGVPERSTTSTFPPGVVTSHLSLQLRFIFFLFLTFFLPSLFSFLNLDNRRNVTVSAYKYSDTKVSHNSSSLLKKKMEIVSVCFTIKFKITSIDNNQFKTTLMAGIHGDAASHQATRVLSNH